MPRHRVFGYAVVAVLALAGCSQSITTSGLTIDKPDEVLDAALLRVQQDNADGLQNQSVTTSDDTRCYFIKVAKESDDVSTTVACGPVRRIGLSDADVWDTYTVQFSQDAKGKVTASLGEAEGMASSMDAALLVRPDGKKPAAAGDIPTPQAPRTDVVDTAAVISPEAAGSISFTDLDKPWLLRTPAATIEVTGTATPEFLPAAVVAPGAGEDGGPAVPYFRAAEGQRALALRMKIGPGAQPDDSADSSGQQLVALDTSLEISVSGRALPVQDLTSSEAGDGTPTSSYTVRCATGGWSSYPCNRAETTQLVMIMSVAADAKPALGARVDGETQRIDLATGQLASTVTQLDYSGGQLNHQIGKLLKVEPVTLTVKSLFGDQDATCSWSTTLQSASLLGLDPYAGWAKPGRAWLVLRTDDHYAEGDCSYYDDVSYLPTITVGKEVYSVASTSRPSRRVFDVPDSFSKGVFRWRPKGTFTGGGSSRSFTAKAAEYTIEFSR